MSEDKTVKDKDKAIEEIKKRSQDSKQQKYQDAQVMLATRAKIEGDYDEDLLKVSFSTSPQTNRTVLTKKPTNKEMITIMKLSAQAAKYEGSADPESLIKMVEIYEQLSGIAAKLSIDDTLDEEFWNEKISFSTLQNFITQLISESQRGTGVSEKDLKKFR
jgi:hypothetical protein